MTLADLIESVYAWALQLPGRWSDDDRAQLAGELVDRYRDPRTWGNA